MQCVAIWVMEKLKEEYEMLVKTNAVLTQENKALKEKVKSHDSADNYDVKESLCKLVVNGEALERRMDGLRDEIVAHVMNLQNDHVIKASDNHGGNGASGSYAGALKKDRTLLVVKSTEKDSTLTQRKEELACVLKDVPVVDTKFTTKGNVVMNFASETERTLAVEKITAEMKDTEMRLAKKLSPKIMICNVSKEENKEEVIDYWIEKKCISSR